MAAYLTATNKHVYLKEMFPLTLMYCIRVQPYTQTCFSVIVKCRTSEYQNIILTRLIYLKVILKARLSQIHFTIG